MSALKLLLALATLAACTSHDPQDATPRGESTGADVPTTEDREAALKREEDRKVREIHRQLGRRVCEEGEHGTKWQEDCNSCWCEEGRRVCTKVGCVKHPIDPSVFLKKKSPNRRPAHRTSAPPRTATNKLSSSAC